MQTIPAVSSTEGLDTLRIFIYRLSVRALRSAAPIGTGSAADRRGSRLEYRPLPSHGGVAGGADRKERVKNMAVRTNKKELRRQQARLEMEEEFRKQVSRERAYLGMTQNELAAQIPMGAGTFSDLLKEPSMFRVWQLMRIVEILGLESRIVAPMLGLEVGV